MYFTDILQFVVVPERGGWELAAALLSVILTFYVLYSLAVYYDSCFNRHESYFTGKTALLVIAHPDDECMFFGPCILNLLKSGCSLHVLCLSAGDHEKLGHKRKEELRNSCQTLGIPMGNVVIIQHSKLPDNPKLMWSRTIVGNIILKYMKDLSANVVLSFDRYGISGHRNHISLYKGLLYIVKEELLPKGYEIFLLETVNIIRKYSAFMDVPISYVAGDLTFISSFNQVFTAQKAMKNHKSQYVWYRRLYIIFSRYMYINTFKQLIA